MVRVCIIGAGPSGMSAVYQLRGMNNPPDILCYDKQDTWGGMWNYSWRTGTDKYGEPNHNGMYKYLWINGPKECFEYPDYTFEQHYKKPIPSFPPRAVMRDYLEGRWTMANGDLKKYVKTNHVVRNVQYREQTDDFAVITENLPERKRSKEIFSHVIVATGIFNVPDVPNFKGTETFNGRVIHSHDFRDARDYKNKRLLVVGSGYSADDITLQCMKYGAKSVIVSWRTNKPGYKWPNNVEERPLVERLDGQHAYFIDGSNAEIDDIILCTGYKYNFPFMEDTLRLVSERSLYPDNLYKGTLWLNGGNNKVFYIGIQDQYFSYTMFDVQALWTAKYIMGELKDEPQDEAYMRKDITKWRQEIPKLSGKYEENDYQTKFVSDLCFSTGYDKSCTKGGELLREWLDDKNADVLTYRDKSFTSIYTNNPAPTRAPWLESFDDSITGFV